MFKRIDNFYKCSLHRELLDEEISKYAINLSGKILDVGSKNRRYDTIFKNAKKITAIDLEPKAKDIIAADVKKMPFENESFDSVICFEVLEYILETDEAFSEIARVLKDKGTFIFSVPFLDPVHGDIDKVRYTREAWLEMLGKYFTVKDLNILGGRYSVIWDFFFEKIRNNYRRISRILLLPTLLMFKKIAIFCDKKEKNWRYPMGYFFICVKN